jgi:hypothetical protein
MHWDPYQHLTIADTQQQQQRQLSLLVNAAAEKQHCGQIIPVA